MAYTGATIANEFLDLAARDRRELTQMHIQKLVFFAHGWNLAFKDQPLTVERFEAWDYGPVIRDLWKSLRKFGSGPIADRVSELVPSGRFLISIIPRIQNGPNVDAGNFAEGLIQGVWQKYGHFTAIQLSELTHLPDSPWSDARRLQQPYIPEESIKRYFDKLRAQTV